MYKVTYFEFILKIKYDKRVFCLVLVNGLPTPEIYFNFSLKTGTCQFENGDLLLSFSCCCWWGNRHFLIVNKSVEVWIFSSVINRRIFCTLLQQVNILTLTVNSGNNPSYPFTRRLPHHNHPLPRSSSGSRSRPWRRTTSLQHRSGINLSNHFLRRQAHKECFINSNITTV